jgi:hypothetical protein
LTTLNIQDINIFSVCNQLERAILDSRSGEIVKNIESSISVKVEDEILFTYKPIYNKITNLNQKYEEILKNILKVSGAYEMIFEFTPNNMVNLKYDNTYYSFNQNNFRKQIETFNDYEGWFKNVFSCFSGNIVLIPDTNFLLYCYYSNYLKNIIQQNKDRRISFCLSRLTLLEIERQINDLSEKIKSKEKKDQKKENQKDEREKQYIEHKRQKRLKFQAIGEISEMMRDGANIIPTYNVDLLTSFSKAAGNSFADSWIRMEIYDYIKSMYDSYTDIIFLTGDLLNGLMSVAENINTIYIYNRNNISFHNRNIIYNLLYTISNSFEKIDLIIKIAASNASSIEEQYQLNGIWEGKTVEEWSNKKIKYSKI